MHQHRRIAKGVVRGMQSRCTAAGALPPRRTAHRPRKAPSRESKKQLHPRSLHRPAGNARCLPVIVLPICGVEFESTMVSSDWSPPLAETAKASCGPNGSPPWTPPALLQPKTRSARTHQSRYHATGSKALDAGCPARAASHLQPPAGTCQTGAGRLMIRA